GSGADADFLLSRRDRQRHARRTSDFRQRAAAFPAGDAALQHRRRHPPDPGDRLPRSQTLSLPHSEGYVTSPSPFECIVQVKMLMSFLLAALMVSGTSATDDPTAKIAWVRDAPFA